MNRRRAGMVGAALLALLAAALGLARCGDPADPDDRAPVSGAPVDLTTSAADATTQQTDPLDPRAPQVIERIAASGVPIRLTRRPRIDVPSPPYGPQLQALQAAADSGDPDARYRLGLMLYQCRDVPADEAGLSRAVEELHQTRSRGGWDVTDPAQEERALRTTYADCQGVPAAARTQYREPMRAAADAGLIEAQLNLMFHLPPGEYCQFIEDCTPAQAQRMLALRDEARTYVSRALDGGSVEALRTVGGWYLNDEMGTPDPVEAYAHFSAYDQIQQAAGRERELTAMLAGLKARLRPVDLAQAETRAKALLSDPDCCVLTR
jgi:TPR repeat protein